MLFQNIVTESVLSVHGATWYCRFRFCFLVGDVADTLNSLAKDGTQVDFVFLDAGYSFEQYYDVSIVII